MNDVTPFCRFIDPISQQKEPLININELEYVGGNSNLVLANLFYPQYFLIWGISLSDGHARPIANITTAALANGETAADYDHVFNGIAVDDPMNPQKLYLTGKYWKKTLVVSTNGVLPLMPMTNPS
jgi:glutamine cyclotransferase